MKKAIFEEKQKVVSLWTEGDMTTVQICQNEEKIDFTDPETGEKKGSGWQYDFNEFTLPSDEVDVDAIESTPGDYLTYQPAAELTDEEKIEKALANSEYAVILAGGEV